MNLATYLRRHELGQNEFAEQIGVTRAAVWNWLQGVRVPKPVMMRRITAATKGRVTRKDFVNGRSA